MPRTSATRQGSQTKKLEEIKHANNVAIAAKSEAVLITKLEAAEKNAAAAEARKARAMEKKSAQSQARKIQVAEKRAANLEAKKIGDGQKNSSAIAKKKELIAVFASINIICILGTTGR
jgi:uncharacterized protein with gpF-like domain